MAIVAGIDEAGYGPVLGPLVVSATAFRAPDSARDGDLWKPLKGIVNRRARAGCLHVNDSKIVHRSGDLSSLEQNVLPFLAQLGPPPATVRRLAEWLECENVSGLDAYPWYLGRDATLPATAVEKESESLAGKLRDALAGAGMAFVTARTEILDAAEFNREIKRDQSKPIPLARRVSILLRCLWDRHGADGLTVFVDKQGGRNFYTALLRSTFAESRIEVIEETADCSEYRIWNDTHDALIRFEPRADSLRLPVALASMLSKYVRELFMGLLNRYWAERVPGLRHTAGYYTDGHRFLSEIAPACAEAGIPMDILVRSR